MTKLPFSRALLSVALTSTLGLVGCDIDDSDPRPEAAIQLGTPNPAIPGCSVVNAATGECAWILLPPDVDGDGESDYYTVGTYPKFKLAPDPKELPLVTDLLFAGTVDGTATLSPSTNAVTEAINDLDGWSTVAPFDIHFSGEIDPDTINDGTDPNPMVAIGQNVFLVPLETVEGGDALDPADIDVANPINSANVALTEFVAGAITLSDVGTNSVLRIAPTKPLMPAKKYLVIVTNGIEDAAGDPITRSAYLEALRHGVPSEALRDAHEAVTAWDQLAVGFLQARNTQVNTTIGSQVLPVDPAAIYDSIAITYTFTTTDPQKPLIAMGAPRAAIVQQQVEAGIDAATAIGNATALDTAGLLSSPKSRSVAFPAPVDYPAGGASSNVFDLSTLSGGALAPDVAKLYTGAITIPYYQTASSAPGELTLPGYGYLGQFWRADMTLASQLGATVPADTDGTSYNVTYRYPFAARTSDVTIPLQVTLPTNPACDPGDDDNFPVVVYVHGITSDRASVIVPAHYLADDCIATVAIDLPVHGVPANSPLVGLLNVDRGILASSVPDSDVGERHFEFSQEATGAVRKMNFDSPDANLDGSGAWFINLANLQNSRDNLRQAVMDLLNLNASLGAIDSDNDGNADFDTSNVSVLGVSLGGIVASTFTTVNQLAIAADTQAGLTPRLYPVQRVVLNSTGAGIGKLLDNSQYFGPRLAAGLGANGVVEGSSSYEQYLYVAQAAVDSGDPMNFAETLAALGLPVLMQEVVGGAVLGDGGTYVADKVIPTVAYSAPLNHREDAPLAGIESLATLLGTGAPVYGLNDATAGSLLVQFTAGHHSSLLRTYETTAPAKLGESIATGEMNDQVVTFLLNPAQTLIGTGASGNGCLILVGISCPPT